MWLVELTEPEYCLSNVILRLLFQHSLRSQKELFWANHTATEIQSHSMSAFHPTRFICLFCYVAFLIGTLHVGIRHQSFFLRTKIIFEQIRLLRLWIISCGVLKTSSDPVTDHIFLLLYRKVTLSQPADIFLSKIRRILIFHQVFWRKSLTQKYF